MKRTFALLLGSLKRTLASMPNNCNWVLLSTVQLRLVQLGQERDDLVPVRSVQPLSYPSIAMPAGTHVDDALLLNFPKTREGYEQMGLQADCEGKSLTDHPSPGCWGVLGPDPEADTVHVLLVPAGTIFLLP